MQPLREHPHLLEINARIWLARLTARERRPVSLATIPQADLDAIGRRFDLLWLMGAWQRSPAARIQALSTPEMLAAYDASLPEWTPEDVDGSPYAVYDYALDGRLGEAGDLGVLRQRLHDVGVRLVVDLVPNHLALDHRWTLECPARLVRVSEEIARSRTDECFRTERGDWLAHGRDPYFPPWTDTVQVNAFSPQAREGLLEQVLSIAAAADGVRCDMAMLGLSDVFERTWGWAVPSRSGPRDELWAYLISRVKAVRPDFIFIAEAYWGLEGRLLDLGFDYAYDKHLYDLFRSSSAAEIRRHLLASGPLLRRSVRFIENHDELRAPVALGSEHAQAAAVATMTLPGLRLLHDGQIEGRRIRLPVQLVREPNEAADEAMGDFYQRLLQLATAPAFHDGSWTPLEVGPATGADDASEHLLAWSWQHHSGDRLILINLSGGSAHGRLADARPAEGWIDLTEPRHPARIERAGSGLSVCLGPWSAHVLGSRSASGGREAN